MLRTLIVSLMDDDEKKIGLIQLASDIYRVRKLRTFEYYRFKKAIKTKKYK